MSTAFSTMRDVGSATWTRIVSVPVEPLAREVDDEGEVVVLGATMVGRRCAAAGSGGQQSSGAERRQSG